MGNQMGGAACGWAKIGKIIVVGGLDDPRCLYLSTLTSARCARTLRSHHASARNEDDRRSAVAARCSAENTRVASTTYQGVCERCSRPAELPDPHTWRVVRNLGRATLDECACRPESFPGDTFLGKRQQAISCSSRCDRIIMNGV